MHFSPSKNLMIFLSFLLERKSKNILFLMKQKLNFKNKSVYYSIMDSRYIFGAIIIILVSFLLWNTTISGSREYFTTQQTDLANKILTFFKSTNNYAAYVKFLVSNNNTSINLTTMATY